jgi:hypothetical protein
VATVLAVVVAVATGVVATVSSFTAELLQLCPAIRYSAERVVLAVQRRKCCMHHVGE